MPISDVGIGPCACPFSIAGHCPIAGFGRPQGAVPTQRNVCNGVEKSEPLSPDNVPIQKASKIISSLVK